MLHALLTAWIGKYRDGQSPLKSTFGTCCRRDPSNVNYNPNHEGVYQTFNTTGQNITQCPTYQETLR